MSRKGDYWDGKFLPHFKYGGFKEHLYNTRQKAKTAIFEYFEDFIADTVGILISATSARQTLRKRMRFN
jgi:hypothetical protein